MVLVKEVIAFSLYCVIYKEKKELGKILNTIFFCNAEFFKFFILEMATHNFLSRLYSGNCFIFLRSHHQ